MPLSPEERRAIALGAATLDERLAAVREDAVPVEQNQAAAAEASAVMRAWSQAFAPGNTSAFLRRLGWDHLSWDLCIQALAGDAPGPEPADWIGRLDLVLEQAPRVLAEAAAGEIAGASGFGAHEPPFVELLVPFSRAARVALDRARPGALDRFSPAAQQTLERQLVRELAPFSERALFQLFEQATGGSDASHGETPGDRRYRAFVASMLDHGMSTLFVAYPVLARIAVRLVDRWVEATADLSARLESDRSALAGALFDGRDIGGVAGIRPGLSDPHHGRQRVAVLTFESGDRAVYKPRDVGLERALSDFTAWANARGLRPSQRRLGVVERPGYGWIEYAERHEFATRDEAAAYYRRAGGLVALAHLLGGADLHMENIVATREGPVIVDGESMVQPSRGVAAADRSDPGDPCVASGIVTFAEIGAGGDRYETGGLRGEGLRGSSRPRRKWEGLRTDGLRCSTEQEFFTPGENRVLLAGIVQRPEEFLAEMDEGYVAAYRFFLGARGDVLAPDGPLRVFDGRRARVMFRATNQYAVLTDVLASPKYQASGVRHSGAMDVIARPFASDTSRPVAWPIVLEERRALEGQDVPHFTVDVGSAEVYAGDRQVDGPFFTTPGLQVVRRRFERLSEQDLSIQRAWLARSLAESAGSGFRTPLALPPEATADGPAGAGAQAVALAIWIGRELLDRAHDTDGRLAWTLEQPGATTTAAGSHYLYGGSLGPAVFLAALGRATGDGSWIEASARAAAGARSFAQRADLSDALAGEPIGAGTGVGSLVYGLALVGVLTDDPSYVDAAATVLRRIDAARIARDAHLDVLAGSAGAILAALALPAGVDDGALDVATACGDHLVARQLHTHWGSNWPSADGRLLAGFAHGAAGIAYALVRLFEKTGRRAYKDAALRAHRYERAVFSPAQKNWPVVRSAGHLPGNIAVVMSAWCHGAPGIALARALVAGTLGAEDPEIAGEIDAALASTAVFDAGGSDHVCCGNLGRAEVLLTVGEALTRKVAVDAARAIAAGVQKQAIGRGRFQLVSNGFEHLVFDAGFFQGLSGIGYELLRIAAPSRLPSVLAFEALGGDAPRR